MAQHRFDLELSVLKRNRNKNSWSNKTGTSVSSGDVFESREPKDRFLLVVNHRMLTVVLDQYCQNAFPIAGTQCQSGNNTILHSVGGKIKGQRFDISHTATTCGCGNVNVNFKKTKQKKDLKIIVKAQ